MDTRGNLIIEIKYSEPIIANISDEDAENIKRTFTVSASIPPFITFLNINDGNLWIVCTNDIVTINIAGGGECKG